MNPNTLALLALILAAIPCSLFLLNLSIYRPLANRQSKSANGISVLIPARNEEQNIGATIDAVLANQGCDFEIVVLDDHSTDRTAAIVDAIARRDHRVRLESAPALPAGWCGKQHACHVLSKLARHPLLLFLDADVCLAPDALPRLASFIEARSSDPLVNRQSPFVNPIALASGVPHQSLGTFSERLLIPLIHFVLLGFLPMHLMRRTRLAAFSAGCGQLFIARRDAYVRCGGHAMLRDSLHDGLKLPRVFRRAGFATGLIDATDIATCRMYRSNRETWRGLGRNATEGLAAPGIILPMTALLLGGQVLPFGLLAFAPMLSSSGLKFAAVAALLALLPRLIAARRFRQPLVSAALHPLGVGALLAIQWSALARHLAGRPSVWKGRAYAPVSPAESPRALG